MLLYLDCPAEPKHIEYTYDDQDRCRAYVTLKSLSPHIIARVCANVRWLSSDGALIAAYNGIILAQARIDPYTVRVVSLTPPKGVHAQLHAVITQVDYALGVDSWYAPDAPPIDYIEQAEPDPKTAQALIAVAGDDAICFPENHGETFVCVCGKLNGDASHCLRCGRDRAAIFTNFTRSAVLSAYDVLKPEIIQTADFHRINDLHTLEDARSRRFERAHLRFTVSARRFSCPPKLKKVLVWCIRIAVLLLCAWIFWLAVAKLREPPRNAPVPTPSLPYNESIIL